jgi:hypothetical protein
MNQDNEKNVMENIECKIFVGNVPYHCTHNEFEKCFYGIEGFINAEIILGNTDDTTRGFGFVTMKSPEHAEKLKQRNDIILKNRILRLTSYYNGETKKYSNENNPNYVTIIGITRDKKWVLDAFSKYGPFGKCFIYKSLIYGKMCAFLEVLDDKKYTAITEKKYHNMDGEILEVCKYKFGTILYNEDTINCQIIKKISEEYFSEMNKKNGKKWKMKKQKDKPHKLFI